MRREKNLPQGDLKYVVYSVIFIFIIYIYILTHQSIKVPVGVQVYQKDKDDDLPGYESILSLFCAETRFHLSYLFSLAVQYLNKLESEGKRNKDLRGLA
jgi:hypothetical protein